MLVLLKTSLSAGNLDEAIQHYKELSASAESAPQLPRHVVMQLVDLSCRERRVEAVLEELETGRMPLTTEMMNAILNECLRAKDNTLAERVQRISAKDNNFEKNSRTYQLLIRLAGNNREAVLQLLDEMTKSSADYSHDIG